MIEKCLIIREPWITEILEGRKSWEMRSKSTSTRGEIGLVAQGTGMIVGSANLVDSLPPLTRANYMSFADQHAIPEQRLDEVLANGWTYPWVLKDVHRFAKPIPYAHRSGAVTFVILESGIENLGSVAVPQPTPELMAKSESEDRRCSSPGKASAGIPVFHLRAQRAHARGQPMPDDSFVVLAGSTAMRHGSPLVKRDREYRDQLLRRGDLIEHTDPELFLFPRNVRFPNSSRAAGVVKDGNASGPQLWRDPGTGKSLKDYLNS